MMHPLAAGTVEGWTSDGGKVDHRLWATVRNGTGVVWLDSGKRTLAQAFQAWEKAAKGMKGAEQAAFTNAIQQAKKGHAEVNAALSVVATALSQLKAAQDAANKCSTSKGPAPKCLAPYSRGGRTNPRLLTAATCPTHPPVRQTA